VDADADGDGVGDGDDAVDVACCDINCAA